MRDRGKRALIGLMIAWASYYEMLDPAAQRWSPSLVTWRICGATKPRLWLAAVIGGVTHDWPNSI